MGDGFYRSKDPTNSIKVLKEMDDTKEKAKNENNMTSVTVHHNITDHR